LVTGCHRFDPARRRGIIGAGRPVRGDLSSGAGCCRPLLYSYVGRGGVRSPTGAGIIGPARGAACPVSSSGGRGIIGPAWHHRAAHGKRPGKIAPRKTGNKKEVNAARAVSTSFFASNFRAAGITRRRCCCRPRRAAGIRRAPCGRRKRP
jgi:hypothetical protein